MNVDARKRVAERERQLSAMADMGKNIANATGQPGGQPVPVYLPMLLLIAVVIADCATAAERIADALEAR